MKDPGFKVVLVTANDEDRATSGFCFKDGRLRKFYLNHEETGYDTYPTSLLELLKCIYFITRSARA